MPSDPNAAGSPAAPFRSMLDATGTHAHCRGCKERVNVSQPFDVAGWHAVHACSPENAIEVHVRAAGAAPWAWRYTADAVAANVPPVPGAPRRRGASRG